MDCCMNCARLPSLVSLPLLLCPPVVSPDPAWPTLLLLLLASSAGSAARLCRVAAARSFCAAGVTKAKPLACVDISCCCSGSPGIEPGSFRPAAAALRLKLLKPGGVAAAALIGLAFRLAGLMAREAAADAALPAADASRATLGSQCSPSSQLPPLLLLLLGLLPLVRCGRRSLGFERLRPAAGDRFPLSAAFCRPGVLLRAPALEASVSLEGAVAV